MLCSIHHLLMCAVACQNSLGIATPPLKTPPRDRARDANLSNTERTRKGHPALAVLDAPGISPHRGNVPGERERQAISLLAIPEHETYRRPRETRACR
jgi:hypothetical protein